MKEILSDFWKFQKEENQVAWVLMSVLVVILILGFSIIMKNIDKF